MRILFVISAFNVGGTEVKIKNVANYLVMNKLADVDILCLSNHIILREQLLPCVGFSSIDATGGAFAWFTVKRKIKNYLFRAPDYDKIIWLNYYPMAIATKNNTHQVAMLNSSNVFGLPSQIKKAIAVKNIPTFDKIIFGNQTLVDEFKHKHPKFSDRFSVLYNGVDIKKFPFNKSTPQQSELPVICMVAKLRPEKRHLDVLKAISNLNAKDFPVKLLAVGGILPEFVEFADELKRFCADNSIEHLVDFVGETKDVGQYLQASDLFLMPSHETFSNALLEAMAYGIPVLGADIAGTAEVIEDNQTGYLYQFSNVDNLTERLYEILQDLPGTLKISNNARLLIENKFSFDAMVDGYLNV